MRALAHPVRLAILQHLGLSGPATATACARGVGATPAACSYHLRSLARHGFVEEDRSRAADGRERPWRARLVSFTLEETAGGPAAERAARDLLARAAWTHVQQVRRDYGRRADAYPVAWRRAAGWVQDVVHVRPEELAALRSAVQQLMAAYRRLGPDERPPGAQRVQVVFDATPWFDPPAGSVPPG